MDHAAAYMESRYLLENEKDVVERWRSGDTRAFEALVRQYRSEAYLTALGLTGNPDDARDLSQDAFIKAFQARASFDPGRPFYPWFYRILKNHCLNFLQRTRKKTEPLFHGDGARERFAAPGPTPLEALEKQERAGLVHAAIGRLSFEHREIIILKHFRGHSYREIADLLDIPVGTVMSRLYYARKAMKDIILAYERGDGPSRAQSIPEGHAAPGEVL